MKRILVPIDFSKDSANALTYAMNLAQRTAAEVTVYHVIFPTQGAEAPVVDVNWLDSYIAIRRDELVDWTSKYTKKAAFEAINVRTLVEIGFPVPLICQYAEDEGFDLIVMGVKGATGLANSIMGSVATGVLSRSKIPSLTIPADARFRRGKTIVMATDFRFHFPESVGDLVREFLRAQNARLTVLHVHTKTGDKPDPKNEEKLTKWLETIKPTFQYLTDSHVRQAINNFVEITQPEALITIGHQHGLFYSLFNESVSRKLATQQKIPVLVLHDTEQV